MATGLGEGKLWIQTSYRPGEGWVLPDYSCLRCTIWLAPSQRTGYGTSVIVCGNIAELQNVCSF